MALLFRLLKHITICLTCFLCSRPFFIVFNQFDMVLLPRIFIHRKQENIHAILSGFNCLQLPKKQMNMFIDMKPWNLMLPPMFQTTLQIECAVLTACQLYYKNVSFFVESSSVFNIYKYLYKSLNLSMKRYMIWKLPE